MTPLALFLYVLRAAFLSSGGFGTVSSLHDDFVPARMATNDQFVEALTVGQLSPGPNGLWVVSLGYLLLGPLGSLAALLAITIPPFLVIGIERLYMRVKHHPAVEGLIQGLTLAVVGTFVVVLVRLLQGPDLNALRIVLTLLAFGLGWVKRIPVVAIIAFCGFVGVLLNH